MTNVSFADESQEKMAVAAAERWLALVDGAEFDESWEQAATYFRDAVPKSQWEQMAKAARKPSLR